MYRLVKQSNQKRPRNESLQPCNECGKYHSNEGKFCGDVCKDVAAVNSEAIARERKRAASIARNLDGRHAIHGGEVRHRFHYSPLSLPLTRRLLHPLWRRSRGASWQRLSAQRVVNRPYSTSVVGWQHLSRQCLVGVL